MRSPAGAAAKQIRVGQARVTSPRPRVDSSCPPLPANSRGRSAGGPAVLLAGVPPRGACPIARSRAGSLGGASSLGTGPRPAPFFGAPPSAVACPSGHPKKAGVSFCKKTHKWRARVEHDGNRKCLGFYSRWDDAAAAVDAERRALQAQVCTHPFLIATLHSRSTHHTRILTTS